MSIISSADKTKLYKEVILYHKWVQDLQKNLLTSKYSEDETDALFSWANTFTPSAIC
jgi:hypothetical protein